MQKEVLKSSKMIVEIMILLMCLGSWEKIWHENAPCDSVPVELWVTKNVLEGGVPNACDLWSCGDKNLELQSKRGMHFGYLTTSVCNTNAFAYVIILYLSVWPCCFVFYGNNSVVSVVMSSYFFGEGGLNYSYKFFFLVIPNMTLKYVPNLVDWLIHSFIFDWLLDWLLISEIIILFIIMSSRLCRFSKPWRSRKCETPAFRPLTSCQRRSGPRSRC